MSKEYNKVCAPTYDGCRWNSMYWTSVIKPHLSPRRDDSCGRVRSAGCGRSIACQNLVPAEPHPPRLFFSTH